MRLLTCAFLLLLFFSLGHASQGQIAHKLDSYNDKIHGSEAEQWNLEDNLLPALVKEPTAKAYIIAYGGREDLPGKAGRYALRDKNYLVELRGIDPRRIVSMDGGRREEFIVELWLVPDKAQPPVPAPTINVQNDPGDNALFDQFELGYDNFGCRTEDAAARLDGFAVALKNEANSWGCIVAYSQSGDDRDGIDWDPPGVALKTARKQSTYLTRKHGLPLSRLSAVDGGYSGRVVQLWLMRPHARFDNGPFLYPSRLKANRNGGLRINSASNSNLCCRVCIRGKTDRYMFRDAKKTRPKRGSKSVRRSSTNHVRRTRR